MTRSSRLQARSPRSWTTRVLAALAAAGLALAYLLVHTGAAVAKSQAGERPGIITTFAGGPGGPGLGTTIAVDQPCGVSSSHHGLVFSESAHNVVRRLGLRNGALSTLDGTGTTGLDNTIQFERNPPLINPCGVAVDHAGNVIIENTGTGTLQVEAERTGIFYGRHMLAHHSYQLTHHLPDLGAVAVDRHGNLLVTVESLLYSDSGPEPATALVHVLAGATGTFYGQHMVAGHLYPLAAEDCPGRPVPGCPAGLTGDGGPALNATFGTDILGIGTDRFGNVVLADTGNNRIRVIAARSGVFHGQQMTAGDIYTIAGAGTNGLGDGGPASQASLSSPQSVSLDRAGNLVIADTGHGRIRVIAAASGTFYGQQMTAGDIYTIAGSGTTGFSGDGGLARKAQFRQPVAAALDSAGNLAIADQGNNRIRLVATRTGTFYGQRMRAGHIYTVAGDGQTTYSGNGVRAIAAQLQPFSPYIYGSREDMTDPAGLATAPRGNVVVADSGNNRVRVIARRGGVFYGIKMLARHIYTVAGTGAAGDSGNGGPGTRATLSGLAGVAVDHAGNVLLANAGGSQFRVIANHGGRFYGRAMIAGHIYQLIGRHVHFQATALAVDQHGNVIGVGLNSGVQVLAARTGRFYGLHMTAGHGYTLHPVAAGNADTFFSPVAVALDHEGNIVFTTIAPSVVDVIAVRTGKFDGVKMRPDHYYQVAGNGSDGKSGNGGRATRAALDWPSGVAVDAVGNILIADTLNDEVRVVAEQTGTFYGERMVAGDIYDVAGRPAPIYFSDGYAGGFSGDGGRARKANLFSPCGIAVYGSGFLVLDNKNFRIREVSG